MPGSTQQTHTQRLFTLKNQHMQPESAHSLLLACRHTTRCLAAMLYVSLARDFVLCLQLPAEITLVGSGIMAEQMIYSRSCKFCLSQIFFPSPVV
jgi:hypothetical protein